MAASLEHVLAQIHRWTSPHLGDCADAVLLERFVQRHDESAFAALVARHGAMVQHTCRRILNHVQEIEDAFQATFLILARKAPTLRQPAALPGYLHCIARRVALKARTKAAARRGQTWLPDELADGHADPLARLTARELLTVLDEEAARLPLAQRSAVLLCCLEGRPQEEAARLLGWTAGSLKGHLERGRRRLQDRLRHRGIALSAALALGAVSRGEAASALLLRNTIAAALSEGSGSSAAALAHSVLRTMLMGKLATAMTVMLTVALIASASVVLVLRGPFALTPEEQTPTVPIAAKNADASKPPVRTDVLGDPLPPRAVARLGSLRLFHGRDIHRVIFSPDGKWAVSSALDGNRLWDAASGRELPLREELRKAAVFTTRDKLVAVAKPNLNLQLWDVTADKKVGMLLPAAKLGQLHNEIHLGFPEGYSSLALAPDGRTLVINNRAQVGAGVQQVLRFCDAVTGKVEEPLPLKLANGAGTRLAFSADSKTLVVQCDNATVHVWDVARRTEKLVSPSNANDYSGPIALSPDGAILTTAPFAGKRIRFWDTRTLKELPSLDKQLDESVRGVSFSPDGKQLASIHINSPLVHLWDVATRKEVRQFHSKEYQIHHVGFSPDGKYLAVGDGGGVTFWDVATGKIRHNFGHNYLIVSLGFSPDGRSLVSGATYTDPIVRIWDPLRGREQMQLHGHSEGIDAVEYAPDGKWIASASQDGTVRLWDAATGSEIRRLEPKDGMVGALALSPDGKTLASFSAKTIQLWDTATGRRLRSINVPKWASQHLGFAADGKSLASCPLSGMSIRFRDVSTGEPFRQRLAKTSRLAINPAGDTFAAGGENGRVTLYDITSGEELRSLVLRDEEKKGNENRLWAVAFSPDERTLAVGYHDHSVRLWELRSGQERAHFEGHRGAITCLNFSPDGNLLASGGIDRLIMVWDVTGQRTGNLPRKVRLRPEEGNTLWNALADADAAKAYRAMQMLMAAGEQTVSLLKQRLHPAAVREERRIDQLIADLDSDRFEVRERAERTLREMGDDAEPALRNVLANRPSAEQRLRVKQLLDAIHTPRSSERLRGLRAVEVLERLGTATARQVLQTLAGGDPQARLTREAKAALVRLAKSPSRARSAAE